MKIRMLSLAAGPAGNLHPNQVAEVADPLGAALVAGGYAVALAEPKAQRAPLELLETAEAPAAPERAIAPEPKHRGKR